MKNILFSVAVATMTAFTANAQWQPVGTAGFSAAGIAHPSLAFNSNNEPYIAFKDGANTQKATVMKFDGTNWVIVGTAGFSAGFASYTSLAFNSSNEPYVAYRDNNLDKLTVKKFDGTNWVTVGTEGFSGDAQEEIISLAFNSNDEPFVAYVDMTVINNAVNQVTVMKFDGTNWVIVGTAGFAFARDISLVFNSTDDPYLAYKDGSNANKATVMKFDGTNWVAVGTAGFSASNSEYTSLAFNSNDEPYVAYRDDANSDKVTVMKFDGTNWVAVGMVGFSAGVASYTSLAFNSSNEPYVAFREFVSGNIQNQATVMKFDGTNWVVVGTPGFSAGYADQTNLAINSNGEPYVAYVDVTQLYKATVMKFGNGTTGVTEVNHNNITTVYPNPANTTLNVEVKETSNINIINMFGATVAKQKLNSGNNSIDVSTFTKGIYFIQSSNGGAVKFIKE